MGHGGYTVGLQTLRRLSGRTRADFHIGDPPKLQAETYTSIVRRQRRSRGAVREADVPRLVGIISQDINPQSPAQSVVL
jgi:hypothetical protein